ncbi:3-oxoacyl-ACP synthase [Spirochaetia bacterium]|nr:3-oxoacyl-ACP synthase [Spirochaetia bacterium]
MNDVPLYITRFTSWAPGLLSDPTEWQEWARGNRNIRATKDSPGIEFTTPLFRRRLSQISRMTIQVIHDLLPIREDTKIVFVSFRGEIAQQLKINRMLIEDGDISPAAFSLSVFNTPPALAAIALDLRAGYSAVYPAEDRFDTGFLAAASPILCGDAEETVLVYADELVPEEYGSLRPPCNEPLAFAALLSRVPGEPAVNVPASVLESPRAFLKYLYTAPIGDVS